MEANRGGWRRRMLCAHQQFSIVFSVIIIRNVNIAQPRKQHIFLNKKAVDGGCLAKVAPTKAEKFSFIIRNDD